MKAPKSYLKFTLSENVQRTTPDLIPRISKLLCYVKLAKLSLFFFRKKIKNKQIALDMSQLLYSRVDNLLRQLKKAFNISNNFLLADC